MAEIVTVEIDPTTGEASIDLTGFRGKGCEAVMKAFNSLGKTKSEQKKPEYFTTPGAGNTVTTGR